MVIARTIVLLLLLACAILFAMYAGTGQARYKQLGIVILKWTLIAAFGFFAVLIAERVLQ